MRRDGKLLKRYSSGEFDRVWREIRSYPTLDSELRHEVAEVANATMRRVAQNADMITERLKVAGWQALSRTYTDFRTAPKPTDQAIISRIAEISGAPIPLTLQAFWQVVGGINWVWDYSSQEERPNLGLDLPSEEHDALYVAVPAEITYQFDEWIGRNLKCDFPIDLAPDYLHKANISGGSPYCIKVPFAGADPLFSDERHGLPFLDYLRVAFRWAGFPGLDRHSDRGDVQSFVARFGKGLLPF